MKTYENFIEKIPTFKTSTNEDEVKIRAYVNNNEVGCLTMDILFSAYYEFDDVLSEDEFNKLYPEDEIVKISHIEVNDEHKESGIAKELMKRGMSLMKKSHNQFYLNASPMGFSGLNVIDLVKLYKKFGFEILLDQGHNVLMSVVF